MVNFTDLKNIVRVGNVSAIDEEENTARVEFKDKDNFVSGYLQIMKSAGTLEIGDFVVCLFLPNGDGDGFILGGVQ